VVVLAPFCKGSIIAEVQRYSIEQHHLSEKRHFVEASHGATVYRVNDVVGRTADKLRVWVTFVQMARACIHRPLPANDMTATVPIWVTTTHAVPSIGLCGTSTRIHRDKVSFQARFSSAASWGKSPGGRC
jgi:hypothetical protein